MKTEKISQKTLSKKSVSICVHLWLIILSIGVCLSDSFAQIKPTGAVRIAGQFSVEGVTGKLTRKRFYLFRGDLKQNAALIERLKTAKMISRSCFYESLKASPQFACWLKTDKFDCESAYCREITDEDIAKVPEFKTAYDLTLKQVGGRKEVARKWLTTNLPANVRDGFYNLEKTSLKTLFADAKPLQNIMTDSLNGTAFFVDIPLDSAAGEMFTVSNVVPFEIGAKSIVWTCEVKVEPKKTVTLNVKNCKFFAQDLQICNSNGCGAAAATTTAETK